MFALAHATGKSGRFTLIERWRNNERQLSPSENPMKVSSSIIFSLASTNIVLVDYNEMG